MKISDIDLSIEKYPRKFLMVAAHEESQSFNSDHKIASGVIKNVQIHSYLFTKDKKKYLYFLVFDQTDTVRNKEVSKGNKNLIMNISLLALIILLFLDYIFYKRKNEYKLLSNYDELTGGYSRHYLKSWMNKSNKNNCSTEYIVMIDVNDIKKINDIFGGDEFILILHEIDWEKAEKIIQRIINQLQQQEKFDFNIEISYGIEPIKERENLFELIKKADQKMYEMKEKK